MKMLYNMTVKMSINILLKYKMVTKASIAAKLDN